MGKAHFENSEEMLKFAKRQSSKFSSFYEARLNNSKMASIQSSSLFRSSPIFRKKIYAMFDAGPEQREHKAINSLVSQIKNNKRIERIEKEHYLDEKSRVDIKITLRSGKILLLEVKHDESRWTLKATSNQVVRYNRAAKKMFGKKFQKTLLCSPQGAYGLSFKETLSYLKAL